MRGGVAIAELSAVGMPQRAKTFFLVRRPPKLDQSKC